MGWYIYIPPTQHRPPGGGGPQRQPWCTLVYCGVLCLLPGPPGAKELVYFGVLRVYHLGVYIIYLSHLSQRYLKGNLSQKIKMGQWTEADVRPTMSRWCPTDCGPLMSDRLCPAVVRPTMAYLEKLCSAPWGAWGFTDHKFFKSFSGARGFTDHTKKRTNFRKHYNK